MAIPKYDEMYNAMLEALSDGKVHDKHDIKMQIKKAYNLTNEEMAEKIPSGRMTVVGNRVGWCKTYLKKAGLVDNPKRNSYSITEAGMEALKEMPTGIDNKYLMKYPGFAEFLKGSKTADSNTGNDDVSVADSNGSPQEEIEAAMTKLNDQLADDLMDAIMQQDPSFFEQLVVDLLEKMGYGAELENPGEVTQYIGDGGIDGIVRQDALGFDKIYVQAKRWNSDHSVGSPDIQQFAGALMGKGANKGLFITTSKFSKAALDYVDRHMTAHIVLIDGRELTGLMIKYGLGVSTEKTYEIKRIDTDYFSSEDE